MTAMYINGKCKAFLYRIAANTCVDMYRKMDIGELSIEDIPAELPSEESGFERIHADLNFHQQIRSLPPEQQEVLLLRFGQELNPAADCSGHRGASAHRPIPAPGGSEKTQISA